MLRLYRRAKISVERAAVSLKSYGLSGLFRTIIEYHVLRRTRYPIFIAPDGSVFILIQGFEEAITSTIDEVFIMREYSIIEDYEPKRGDTVIDAGAFIGAYTIYAARRANKVVALEPSPLRVLLLYNISMNSLRNVTVLPYALANYNGYVDFFFNTVGPTGSSLYSSNKNEEKLTKVPVSTLDSLIENLKLKKINILKMDIEGAECLAIEGAQNLLREGSIERIVLELHPWICPRERLLNGLRFNYKLDYEMKFPRTTILYFRNNR